MHVPPFERGVQAAMGTVTIHRHIDGKDFDKSGPIK
jgi:hypothetical protein